MDGFVRRRCVDFIVTSSTPLLIELPPNAKRHDSIALIIACLNQTTIELSTSRLRSLDGQTKMTLTIVSNDESLQRSIHALVELHSTLSAPHGVPIAQRSPNADLLADSSRHAHAALLDAAAHAANSKRALSARKQARSPDHKEAAEKRS